MLHLADLNLALTCLPAGAGYSVDRIDARIIGGVVALCAAVTVVLWSIGIYLIKMSESAFARYVSQNVNYTSIIILKVGGFLQLLMCECIYITFVSNTASH